MTTVSKASVREAKAANNGLNPENSSSTPATPRNLSIDDIMWRVRAEVARRRNGGPAKEPTPTFPDQIPSFDESIPSWKPAAARLPAKDRYTLSELLVFSDADFIDVAYHAVLR